MWRPVLWLNYNLIFTVYIHLLLHHFFFRNFIVFNAWISSDFHKSYIRLCTQRRQYRHCMCVRQKHKELRCSRFRQMCYRRTPHAARVTFSSLWQKDQGCHAIGQVSSLYADGLKKLSMTHLQFFTAVSLSLPGCPRLCAHLSLEMTDFSVDRLNLQCEMASKEVSQCWTVSSPFNSALKAHSWHLNEAFTEGKMHLWRWSSHSERCALITQLCWSWTECLNKANKTQSKVSFHECAVVISGRVFTSKPIICYNIRGNVLQTQHQLSL